MPRQTSFARFLATPENRSALQAIKDLSGALLSGKNPPTNPLYLHGPPGSGKSHLVHALVSELTAAKRSIELQILPASDVRETGTKLRAEGDLVVIEDLQHLPRWAKEWLVGLLDDRTRRCLPTVLTAVFGPQHLRSGVDPFSARLTSRLAGGLVVAVEPLQAPSRLLLLLELAQRQQLAVSRDILQWLAERLIAGGRQLEGAIIQLANISKLSKRPLTCKDVAAHFEPQVDALRPTVERIARQVGGYFRIDAKELRSKRRHQSILLPRQVGMYLARQLTQLSLGKIGAYFGGRDHTTVLHSCRKVELALADDTVLSGAVRQIHAELA